MIADEMDLLLPELHASDTTPPAGSGEFEVLTPHAAIALDGVLCCGQPAPRHPGIISGIALQPLTNLVRQVTDWTHPSGDERRYLGDHRFLVLDATTASGILFFVQIWSEPFSDLIMEVGPGDRQDAAQQSFADKIRNALYDRGFEIGGDAGNFRKALPIASKLEAPRVAREMLAILMEVLGYDGSIDLAYRLLQGSNLRADHVVTGLSSSTLHMLCLRWGLRSRISVNDDNLLEAADLFQDFQLNLFCPHVQRKDHFWEVHCVVFLGVTCDKAGALIDEVNGKPHLMKAFVTSDRSDLTQQVRLSCGINLAGGVTLDHVRCQILEFLEGVRSLRRSFVSN